MTPELCKFAPVSNGDDVSNFRRPLDAVRKRKALYYAERYANDPEFRAQEAERKREWRKKREAAKKKKVDLWRVVPIDPRAAEARKDVVKAWLEVYRFEVTTPDGEVFRGTKEEVLKFMEGKKL